MKIIITAAVVIFLFSSCEKKPVCPSSLELRANTLTPTVGDDLIISAPEPPNTNVVFQWNGPRTNETNQSSSLQISDIKLSQSGTYYCNLANTDCNTSLGDSIVINVQLKQETPPCTITNNTVTASSIPGTTFGSVTKSYGGSWNTLNLYASAASFGYPSYTVLFNSYNGNVEPRDGVYTTTDIATFSPLQEPNEISISFIYSSNYFHCRPGNKVYVSHVGGKLQVNFCNLEFASPPFVTTCSGKITQTN